MTEQNQASRLLDLLLAAQNEALEPEFEALFSDLDNAQLKQIALSLLEDALLPGAPITITGTPRFDIHLDWKQADEGGRLAVFKLENGRIVCGNRGLPLERVKRILHAAVDTLLDTATLED